jgi:YD repeat-containing protein
MVRQDFTNGTTTTTVYDPLMRASQIRHGYLSNGVEIDHTFLTYDGAGRPILEQSQLGNYTYGYDSLDRLIVENNPIGGLVTTAYDLNGRRLSQVTPLARLSYSYDPADQLLTTAYTQLVTTPYQINCGGGAVAPYIADSFFTGGSVMTTSNTIDTSAISNPAPQAVYQSERYASSFIAYTLPNLLPNVPYTLRLHFAQFNTDAHTLGTLYLNRTPVTTSVDLYELCGGQTVPTS